MLGFSGITGTDTATGQLTSIDELNGSESNSYNGVTSETPPFACAGVQTYLRITFTIAVGRPGPDGKPWLPLSDRVSILVD
jgi:hypothetical protein